MDAVVLAHAADAAAVQDDLLGLLHVHQLLPHHDNNDDGGDDSNDGDNDDDTAPMHSARRGLPVLV